jgi:hypothetical protein
MQVPKAIVDSECLQPFLTVVIGMLEPRQGILVAL